jgi:hypothetical protein
MPVIALFAPVTLLADDRVSRGNRRASSGRRPSSASAQGISRHVDSPPVFKKMAPLSSGAKSERKYVTQIDNVH